MGTLDTLRLRQTATVQAVTGDDDITQALAEAGLLPGAEVEILARGLIGGTPLSVRVGRAVLALRRSEARRVSLS